MTFEVKNPKSNPNVIINETYINKIPNKKYYVTMTDTFLSGWGRAEGKTNKLVIGCDSYEEAEKIKRNAELRSEMKYVNITTTKPHYKHHILTSYKEYSDLGEIWKK